MAYRIGLDLKMFWRLNPRRMKPFLDLFEQKQREDRDRLNFHAYMTGVYVRDAISACFGKNSKYPSTPYDLRSQEEIDASISPEEYNRRLILMNEYNDKERKRMERGGNNS